MKILKDHGARPVGVEPLLGFVRLAGEYLGDPESVLQGAAEAIPLPDESQDVVLFESVLEHVDSPAQSLQEIFRVLKPGGVAYVVTTNRLQFSWRGANGEYQVPFYNWLPSLVKESYVFAHLHYRPRLANYSPRPAVHWFTYASLCRLGRDAGFAQFYSPLDLRMPSDFASSASRLKRVLLGGGFLLRALQRSAWLRSLALTQVGEVIMWKRSTFDVSA
jgi:SAM-dependent methyltransferase